MTTMTPGAGGAAIDPSQPGLFIFTDLYYSAVYSLGADPRPLSVVAFSATPEEMIAQYQTIIVNTGTYEASGATVTFRHDHRVFATVNTLTGAVYVDLHSTDED